MAAAPAGHVSLSLSLERPSALLLKASATDTIFSLDSLVIILTAASSDTLEHRIALAGRADTGNIALPELVFELPALRNWKATIYSSIRQHPTSPRRACGELFPCVRGG